MDSINAGAFPSWLSLVPDFRLVLCSVVVLPILYLVLVPLIFDKLRHVPGPFQSHFGNLVASRLAGSGDYAGEVRKLHDQYGPLVRIGAEQVHVAAPEALPIVYSMGEKYLKTSFYDFFRFKYNGRTVDTVLSTRSPEAHRLYLSQSAAVTSRVNMRLYEPIYNRVFMKFCELTAKKGNEPVELHQWMLYWALDVNCAELFGHEYGFMEADSDVNGVLGAIVAGSWIIAVFGHFPLMVKILNSDLMIQATRFITGQKKHRVEVMYMIEELMDTRERESADKEDCMFMTLRNSIKAERGGMSREDMVMHCADLFQAGAFTTVVIYTSIMYGLAKDTRIFSKLSAEVQKAATGLTPDECISFEKAMELPYLQAVVQEGLRMIPAAGQPPVRYVPAGGAEICGHFLPGGTSIGTHPSIIHMNTEIYGKDATQFRPERWLEADKDVLRRMQQNMMTFARGNYMCKGQRRALLELHKFTFEVVRRFELEWARGQDEEWEVTSYWFQHIAGAPVRFKPRQNIL